MLGNGVALCSVERPCDRDAVGSIFVVLFVLSDQSFSLFNPHPKLFPNAFSSTLWAWHNGLLLIFFERPNWPTDVPQCLPPSDGTFLNSGHSQMVL